MPHIGVKGLCTGRREEDCPHDGDPCTVGTIEVKQVFKPVPRVERLEDRPVVAYGNNAYNCHKGKPGRHDDAENAAYSFCAAGLHCKKYHDDDHSDDHCKIAVPAENPLYCRKRFQAFDCGRYGYCRGKHGIGKESRTAYHCRDPQPFRKTFDHGVQGENASFAFIVDPHGDQHIFYCSDKRDGPEKQGKHTQDGCAVNIPDAALPCHE